MTDAELRLAWVSLQSPPASEKTRSAELGYFPLVYVSGDGNEMSLEVLTLLSLFLSQPWTRPRTLA